MWERRKQEILQPHNTHNCAMTDCKLAMIDFLFAARVFSFRHSVQSDVKKIQNSFKTCDGIAQACLSSVFFSSFLRTSCSFSFFLCLLSRAPLKLKRDKAFSEPPVRKKMLLAVACFALLVKFVPCCSFFFLSIALTLCLLVC